MEVSSAWAAVLAAEPRPWRYADEAGVASAALVIADFCDLKSGYFRGHSRGVAALAAAAAGQLGLDAAAAEQVRLAGLVHDLGRVTVSAGVWDRPGPLMDGEWEAVRLHAHWTERVLGRVAPLAAAGRLAGLHHERLDGSGYHRGSAAASLPMPARVLAAADVCHAVTQERPHRPALSPDAAGRVLAEEVTAGDWTPTRWPRWPRQRAWRRRPGRTRRAG
jgi:HD-GYP domain-containing protein (c-di-GMP phosphodiesterase class II)